MPSVSQNIFGQVEPYFLIAEDFLDPQEGNALLVDAIENSEMNIPSAALGFNTIKESLYIDKVRYYIVKGKNRTTTLALLETGMLASYDVLAVSNCTQTLSGLPTNLLDRIEGYPRRELKISLSHPAWLVLFHLGHTDLNESVLFQIE